MSTPLPPPGQRTSASFFGINLSALRRDFLAAWQGMLDWPLLSWAWPQSSVCLHIGPNRRALCTHLDTAALEDDPRAASAKLNAVLLPEELLLRRTVDLPALQREEEIAAVALEAQALSPFPAQDTLWLYEPLPTEGHGKQASLLICSRQMVDRHLEATHPLLMLQSPEVWVGRAGAPGYAVLPGFGADQRHQHDLAARWSRVALALSAMFLLAGIALTPTAQLYLRTLQAMQAMQALQKHATPAMTDREALLHASEKMNHLQTLLGTPTPPLQILNQVTEALPDDTSLSSLQIQGTKVSMSGQTPNASALMKSLGSTPGLREVRAPTPAVKPLGAPRETFNIEFTVDPLPGRTSP